MCVLQLKKALEDLTEVLAEKEELSQRCQELDIQVQLTHTCRNIPSCCLAAASTADVCTSVCALTHKWPPCSLNRSYVIRCDAWAHCLELLWQKACGITVWAPLWSPASGSPTHTRQTEVCRQADCSSAN